jgi:hypothetical protein
MHCSGAPDPTAYAEGGHSWYLDESQVCALVRTYLGQNSGCEQIQLLFAKVGRATVVQYDCVHTYLRIVVAICRKVVQTIYTHGFCPRKYLPTDFFSFFPPISVPIDLLYGVLKGEISGARNAQAQ